MASLLDHFLLWWGHDICSWLSICYVADGPSWEHFIFFNSSRKHLSLRLEVGGQLGGVQRGLSILRNSLLVDATRIHVNWTLFWSWDCNIFVHSKLLTSARTRQESLKTHQLVIRGLWWTHCSNSLIVLGEPLMFMWHLIGPLGRYLIIRITARLSSRNCSYWLPIVLVVKWFSSLSLLTYFEIYYWFCSLGTLSIASHLGPSVERRMDHRLIKRLHFFTHESWRVLFLMILCAKIICPVNREIAAIVSRMSWIINESIGLILLINYGGPQGSLVSNGLVRLSCLEARMPLSIVLIWTFRWWWFKSSQSLLSEADHYF